MLLVVFIQDLLNSFHTNVTLISLNWEDTNGVSFECSGKELLLRRYLIPQTEEVYCDEDLKNKIQTLNWRKLKEKKNGAIKDDSVHMEWSDHKNNE